MKVIRVEPERAIIEVEMYDLGQILDGLGAMLRDEPNPVFEADGRALYQALAALVFKMGDLEKSAGSPVQ